MSQLVLKSECALQALGQVSYDLTETEKTSNVLMRALYLVQNLKAGDGLSKDNVRAIRPGLGLPPKYLDVVLGKRVKLDVKRGSALVWSILE